MTRFHPIASICCFIYCGYCNPLSLRNHSRNGRKAKLIPSQPLKLAQETFLHVGRRWPCSICSISLLVSHTFRPQLCGQRRHNAQPTSSSCNSCTWPEQGLALLVCCVSDSRTPCNFGVVIRYATKPTRAQSI